MPDPLPLHVTIGYRVSNWGRVQAYRTRDEAAKAWQANLTHIQCLISEPPPFPPLPSWPAELAGTPEQRLGAISGTISKTVEITGGKSGLIHAALKRMDTFEGHELSSEQQWLEVFREDLSPSEADAFQICLTALRLLPAGQRRRAVQPALA